jgi:hypothetical protein
VLRAHDYESVKTTRPELEINRFIYQGIPTQKSITNEIFYVTFDLIKINKLDLNLIK